MARPQNLPEVPRRAADGVQQISHCPARTARRRRSKLFTAVTRMQVDAFSENSGPAGAPGHIFRDILPVLRRSRTRPKRSSTLNQENMLKADREARELSARIHALHGRGRACWVSWPRSSLPCVCRGNSSADRNPDDGVQRSWARESWIESYGEFRDELVNWRGFQQDGGEAARLPANDRRSNSPGAPG